MPGANISLTPKALDKPQAPAAQPPAKAYFEPDGATLPTGKYLLEITHPGHNRWLRHVYITRGETKEIAVSLSPAKPEELRTP